MSSGVTFFQGNNRTCATLFQGNNNARTTFFQGNEEFFGGLKSIKPFPIGNKINRIIKSCSYKF